MGLDYHLSIAHLKFERKVVRKASKVTVDTLIPIELYTTDKAGELG